MDVTSGYPSREAPTLRLQPEAGAPRQARAWVEALVAGWPADAVESARLVISEVVTNAVLHATTPLTISGELYDGDRRARVAVADGHRGAPLPKHYEPDSATGRGVQLIASLAKEWGVAVTPDGKCVWFVVEADATPARDGNPGGGTWTDAWQHFDGLQPDRGEPGEVPPGMVRVAVLDLPLRVYLEAEQHNDAVMRELTLIAHSSTGGPEGLDIPRRLLELSEEVRARFSTATTSLRRQVERARRSGAATLDMHVDVPAVGWEALLRLAAQLDELDTYCEAGDLLTLASPPSLRYFRKWYAQEVANQLSGRPATPWQEPAPDELSGDQPTAP